MTNIASETEIVLFTTCTHSACST